MQRRLYCIPLLTLFGLVAACSDQPLEPTSETDPGQPMLAKWSDGPFYSGIGLPWAYSPDGSTYALCSFGGELQTKARVTHDGNIQRRLRTDGEIRIELHDAVSENLLNVYTGAGRIQSDVLFNPAGGVLSNEVRIRGTVTVGSEPLGTTCDYDYEAGSVDNVIVKLGSQCYSDGPAFSCQ